MNLPADEVSTPATVPRPGMAAAPTADPIHHDQPRIRRQRRGSAGDSRRGDSAATTGYPVDESGQRSASTTLAGPPLFSERYLVTLMLAICAGPMLLLAFVQRFRYPDGDQPHYLVISEALLRHHSVHVLQVYQHKQYWSFYPHLLPPHVAAAPHGTLPWHGIGGPILWLIPYALAGRTGVMLFMIGISLLTVANIYWGLRDMGIDRAYAFVTGVAFGLGSAILTYSNMAFVEPLGALACVYAFRILHKRSLRDRELLLASTALGVLPWIHTRFVLLEVPLLALLLWRLRRTGAGRLRYVKCLAPAVTLAAAFELYYAVVWHTLDPRTNQAIDQNRLFTANVVKDLIGATLDQEHGVLFFYPIFLFVLPGLVLALRRRYRLYHTSMLIAVGPYVIVVLGFQIWWGGWAPPARLFAAVLPMLAFYVAYALQRVHSAIVMSLAAHCVVVTMALEGLSRTTDSNGFSGESGFMVPLTVVERITHKHLIRYLPSWNGSHDRTLFVYWGLAAIGFGLLVWLIAMRTRLRRTATISP